MKYISVLVATLLLSSLATTVLAADFVLIANKGNTVSSLSENDARQIYLGKKSTWPDGQAIVLYMQQNEAVTGGFAEAVAKKTPQQFQIYWKKALFTGTGKPPIEVRDDAEMKKFIAADPRGIGYISRAAFDGSVKEISIR